MIRLLFAIIAVTLASHAVAGEVSDDDNFNPVDGWFWYKKLPEENPEQETKKPEVEVKVKPSDKDSKPEKKPMSVAWLRKMLPILMDRAEDNPTKENLAAYFYAQRVMADKSQRYSEEAQKFVYSDPMLDENNRVPTSGSGKTTYMDAQFKSKDIALKHLAKDVGGLFFFFDSKCEFCKNQLKTIKYLEQSYGFNVKYISMDGKGLPGIENWVPDNGHAKMLNLKVYPTTVFAVPPSTYLIVSQGMMAKDQLSDRILTAAMSNKLLPDSMEKTVNPWDTGVLSVDDMQDGASDDPDVFVKNIQEKLKKRY